MPRIRTAAIMIGGAALLSLSACATPETRLRNGLRSAGLSAPMAECMARRMADRLSIGQLNKLASLGKARGKDIGDMKVDEFLRHVSAFGDPEILGVATSSAAICAVY